MEQENLRSWATVLNDARAKAAPIAQISNRVPSFPRSDAYAIQEEQYKLRQLAGETRIGWKMGLTSEAKRRQMNLDAPLYGFLTNRMQISHEGMFPLQGSIHPKIEPEIAFLMKADLGPAPSREQVLQAVEGVAGALEILDSRYTQFKYFSMEDVIADNSSSSHFVVGPWRRDFKDLDLRELKMEMSVNGDVVQRGLSKDISNDPVVSVQQLCALLAERGETLKAGSIVLAGAATAAVELKPGMNVGLTVDGLAPLRVRIQR